MRIRSLPALVSCFLVAAPGIAAAQDEDKYRCTNGDLERRIEIVRETGVLVPCEVHYYKDSEAPGEKQVLWSAQREEGYCESRAAEFVQQLADWGWQCAGADIDVEAAPGEAAPDEASGEESVD